MDLFEVGANIVFHMTIPFFALVLMLPEQDICHSGNLSWPMGEIS